MKQVASPRSRYRKLIFLTWFLTLDLIMFGAFVRLTDSGLGCPDWPGCYGSVTPIGAIESIRQAVQVMPDGPVTLPKAWIEMIHRYVGALLGFLIIMISWMAWRHREKFEYSPQLLFLPWLQCACKVRSVHGP
jgi:cytochrome c oxidase assembly protein subunit 15